MTPGPGIDPGNIGGRRVLSPLRNPSHPPPPPLGRLWAREWRDSAKPRLRDAECYEVSVAKIMEHSNSRTKCDNITCSG